MTTTPRRRWARGRRSLHRALARRRRVLVAALIAAALAAGLQSLRPAPPATTSVLVAARDLPAGHVITDSDVRGLLYPVGTAPSGMIRTAAGLTLRSSVRAGEPLTDARVGTAGMLLGQPPGVGAMGVRVDRAGLAMVRSGDRIDLLAGPAAGPDTLADMAKADVIADDVLVLAVSSAAGAGSGEPAADGAGPGPLGTGAILGAGPSGEGTDVVVVAVDRDAARRIAAVSGTRSLSVVVRGLT